jgi:urease accessory protein
VITKHLSLLHLCDSLFPTGSFTYSDGLEWAARDVGNGAGLRQWLDVCLNEAFRRSDGPALLQARIAFDTGNEEALLAVDEELMALRASSSVRAATRSMGRRLLTTWHELHPDIRLARLIDLARGAARSSPVSPAGTWAPAFPVAFGAVSGSASLELRDALAGFAYSRLASTVSAAMRVMSIGQSEAHLLLARTLDRVPPVVDAIVAGEDAPLESFSPAFDIAQMSHQYLHSRLFRS